MNKTLRNRLKPFPAAKPLHNQLMVKVVIYHNRNE